MNNSEKFSLKWNDFESNISSAFSELREERELFDVTLVCDDNQIDAHKVVISACSPFFRSILKKTQHSHPLVYLRGVPYSELVSVLQFMYRGEVSVAQEHLNSFLSTAEDLKVKGLSQGKAGEDQKSKPVRRPPSVQPQERDEDIQEIVPIKIEAGNCSTVAVEDPQEEGYEYLDQDGFQYEQYSYETQHMELDKGQAAILKKLNDFVKSNFYKTHDGEYHCSICGYSNKTSTNVGTHIETNHVSGEDKRIPCLYCDNVCPSRSALRMHMKKHKNLL